MTAACPGWCGPHDAAALASGLRMRKITDDGVVGPGLCAPAERRRPRRPHSRHGSGSRAPLASKCARDRSGPVSPFRFRIARPDAWPLRQIARTDRPLTLVASRLRDLIFTDRAERIA